MKYLEKLILLSLFLPGYLGAQTKEERLANAESQISTALLSYGNHTAELDSGVTIIDVDSSIGDAAIADGGITDPYGTLKGCFLFAAYDSAETGGGETVGVFKDGSILWLSDPFNVQYSEWLGGSIGPTLDLNKDSSVEILASWITGGRAEDEALWIFSWNGLHGTRINSIDTLGFTTINAYGFSVHDIDGDGIFEVTGDIATPDTGGGFKVDGIVTYCWNGSLYGEWPDCPQVGNRIYAVGNNLQAEVRAEVVTLSTGELEYRYTIFNKPSSRQKIATFYVEESVDSLQNSAPAGWVSGRLRDVRLTSFDEYPDTTRIPPGNSLGIFGIKALSVPAVKSFYIQAYHELINFLTEDPTQQDQQDIEDIYGNSIVGLTIGPCDPTRLFDIFNLLDTIKSEMTQCRTLGWIKDQPTANKYSTFIDSTKAQLQRADSASALMKLDSIMQQSIQDSSSSLTSEAFALIYFNAQYLASQLPAPQQPSSFTITSSAGQNGSVAPLGDNMVNAGDSITFSFAPATGYHISGVFIDNADTSVGQVPSYTFRNVTANHQISAFFAINQYIITAIADSNGQISPNGDNVVNYGDSITFRINPSTGYHVASVYVDSLTPVGAVPRYTFGNVTANHTIDAFFAINQYTLSTYSINGTISKSPNKSTYDGNSVVTLSATPNTGYHFVGWSGDASGSTNPLNVTMNANKNDTAIFAETSFIITALSGGNGTISPPGDNSVNYGDSIVFFMTPAPCYHVSGVYRDSTDSLGALSSYTFDSVKANHTIDAFFAINQYTITASNGPNGSISPHGDSMVNCGDSVTFTIIPAAGYHIDGVYIDSIISLGAVSSYTFTNVTAGHTIDAFFAINQYALILDTVPLNGGGVTKYPDRTQYDSNSVVQLTAVPNTCYHFVNWSGDASSSTNPLNVTMNAGKNITANFAINTYMITATAGPNGGMNPDSNVVVNCGDSITFRITPATGYHVSGVYTDSVTSVGAVTSHTFRSVC